MAYNECTPFDNGLVSGIFRTELRGRKRRQARRHGYTLVSHEPSEPVYGLLRGRSRRRQRRWARLADRGTPASEQHDPRVRTAGGTSRAMPIFRGPNTALATSPNNRNHLSSPATLSRWKVVPQQARDPSWLTDASIRCPLEYRRISDYLDTANSVDVIVLHKATIDAVHKVGQQHSSDLLKLLIDRCKNVRLTVIGTLTLMEWIDLPSFKRLKELSIITIDAYNLIKSAARNISHGVKLVEHMIKDLGFSLNDDQIHDILMQAMLSIERPSRRISGKQDATIPRRHCLLAKNLLDWFPEVRLSSDIIREALEAEVRGADLSQRLYTAEPPIELMLGRCTGSQDFQGLLETVLGGAKLTTLGPLLDRWPGVNLTRKMMKLALRRWVREEEQNRWFEDWTSQGMVDLLVSYNKKIVSDEPFIVNTFCLLDSAEVLGWLHANDVKVEVSQLTERIAISLLRPSSLQKYFLSDDTFIEDDVILEASMDNDLDVIEYLLSCGCETITSFEAVLAAAEKAPFSVFRDVLRRYGLTSLDPLLLLACMRSPHSAIRKTRMIVSRGHTSHSMLDEAFWVALISTAHQDLLAVMEFLSDHFRIKTTDSMIAATWHSEHAFDVLKILLTDPDFEVSSRTISTVLRRARSGGYSRVDPFPYLLDRCRWLVVTSSLIAESLCFPTYTRMLLRRHGKPDRLCINERQLLLALADGDSESYSGWNPLESIQYFVKAGGRLKVTPRVLHAAVNKYKDNFKLVWVLWQNQPEIDLPTMIRLWTKKHRHHEFESILDCLMHTNSSHLSKSVIDAFEIAESDTKSDSESVSSDSSVVSYSDVTSNMYEALLGLLKARKFDKFEEALRYLGDPVIPIESVEKLMISFLGDIFPASHEHVERVIELLIDKCEPITFGETFFDSLYTPRHTVLEDEGRLDMWMSLLNRSFIIDWSVQSQARIFATQSVAVTVKLMTAIRGDFCPSEELVMEAIKTEHALAKLEFIWQGNSQIEVTESMVEAAIAFASVDVLDFLISKSQPPQVTDRLLLLAIRRVPIDRMNGYWGIRKMVRCLVAHAVDLKIGQLVVQTAIVKLDRDTVCDLLIPHYDEAVGKEVLIAMFENKWPAEDMYHLLEKATNGLSLLNDLEVVSKAAQSKRGRQLLRLAGIDDEHVQGLVDEVIFKKAVGKCDDSNWPLLDHLDRAADIDLDDTKMAHLWKAAAIRIPNRIQIVNYILEHEVRARMGSETFKLFWSTCTKDDYIDTPYRVCRRLPNLPIDIDDKLVAVARDDRHGHIALDAVLGPDYQPVIHESALVAMAASGEEVLFRRLLFMAYEQGVTITDKTVLVDAARVGGNQSVVQVCKLLRNNSIVSLLPASAPSAKRIRKFMLHTRHYFVRQRYRLGRPKYSKPMRQGFRQYLMKLRMIRSLVKSRDRTGELITNHVYPTSKINDTLE